MDFKKIEDILQISTGIHDRIAPIYEIFNFKDGVSLSIRAVEKLQQMKPSHIIVIGIAGSSGSGKSYFAKDLVKSLHDSTVISMDNYMQREKVTEGNFDAPDLLDVELLHKNITEIKAGNTTLTPVYSFTAGGRRIGYIPTPVPKNNVLIIEGTYVMNELLRPLYDITISVSGGIHFDIVKRMLRDIIRVGQNPSELINQIADTVFPMYKAFIEPDLTFATIKIKNTYNPFQDIKDLLYILKSDIIPSIEKIKEIVGDDVVEVEEEYMDLYMYILSDSSGTYNNWIRIRKNLKNHKYYMMFSEWQKNDDFIKCPLIEFEVSVRIIGSLMSLGYSIGFHVYRTSHIFKNSQGLIISLDKFPSIPLSYIQIKGSTKETIDQIGTKLGLTGHYKPKSYIELLQARISDVSLTSTVKSAESIHILCEQKRILEGKMNEIIALLK